MVKRSAGTKRPKGVREESVGYLVNQMADRMNALMREELEPLGLDIRFFANLMTLLIEDELSQVELGARVGEAQYTTSRIVDALERDGLVERKQDPNSRRAHRILLTEKGRQLAGELPALVSRVNGKVLEELTEKEQARLVQLLRKALHV